MNIISIQILKERNIENINWYVKNIDQRKNIILEVNIVWLNQYKFSHNIAKKITEIVKPFEDVNLFSGVILVANDKEIFYLIASLETGFNVEC